ncbi:MAG: IS110 family transposase [Syntrophaceae bacterium]|nr:IS110 family transposase [Syntrophaceae bacterium]
MKHTITIVGLDVHKNSIEIVTAETGGTQEVRRFGKTGGDMASLDKAIRKLRSKGALLRFVYEAGPCGYEIYRHLTQQGFLCKVVAPSMTPRKSGDRVKTDRRDAEHLARLERAGELTSVYVPREEDEAMRDLTRAREDAVKAQRTARQQLGAFLLRQGHRYPGKTSWTPVHTRWLSDIAVGHPAQQIVLQEYIHAVASCTARVDLLTDQILKLLPAWRMAPVVKALQALRGVAPIVAVTTVAEIGDINRFESPRQLMIYLGLIPSEHSSGERTRRGGITKTGNGHVRRSLVEAAHAYSHPARISRLLLRRQEGLQPTIREIAWKAQVRLCGRFRRLMARGKARNKVVTAVARELAGFIWAIAREVQLQKA